MNASKEEAKKAKDNIWKAAEEMDKLLPLPVAKTLKMFLLPIERFLEAAERKLPSEAAYERERKRNRTKKEHGTLDDRKEPR